MLKSPGTFCKVPMIAKRAEPNERLSPNFAFELDQERRIHEDGAALLQGAVAARGCGFDGAVEGDPGADGVYLHEARRRSTRHERH